ncbi:hypothetical protein SK128_022611 [Halocaridina rubra]|uniref:Uncharacterized protein n=1 Tax=Halocaridina rubra TaxID=373956 RepID=A0AAN9A041_HALRR
MKDISFVLAFCVGAALPAFIVGSLNLGTCPDVQTQPNFNMTRFEGALYVVYAKDIPTPCLVMIFKKFSKSKVSMWKTAEIINDNLDSWGSALDVHVFENFEFYHYELAANENNLAHMTWKKWVVRKYYDLLLALLFVASLVVIITRDFASFILIGRST